MSLLRLKHTKNIALSLFNIVVICLIAKFVIVYPRRVRADNLQSPSYIIQFGNFNITSGEKSSDNYAVTDTVGQIGAGPFGQPGSSSYFLGSGFQYIYPLHQFRFVISKLSINLGLLTDASHNQDNHTLFVRSPGAGGYQVFAYALHPLRLLGGTAIIPNTTCDNNNCNKSNAAIWQNQNIGGFGFNVSGDDHWNDFISPNYFRPFANNSINEVMQPVMGTSGVAINREATVTYKAGLFGNEPAGQYETAVVYIAVPAY